jgi:hypothetical protein
MVALTSTTVPLAQDEDGSRLRAMVDRIAKEVNYYTSQYEDQCQLVEALGTTLNAPENKSVLDILTLRERRLDAALGRENTTIANLIIFCVAERSVLQAQAAATAMASAISAPPVPTTTSKAVADKKDYEEEAPGTPRWMERRDR